MLFSGHATTDFEAVHLWERPVTALRYEIDNGYVNKKIAASCEIVKQGMISAIAPPNARHDLRII